MSYYKVKYLNSTQRLQLVIIESDSCVNALKSFNDEHPYRDAQLIDIDLVEPLIINNIYQNAPVEEYK